MKCPGCGYNSFDHLTICKKCGIDFAEVSLVSGRPKNRFSFPKRKFLRTDRNSTVQTSALTESFPPTVSLFPEAVDTPVKTSLSGREVAKSAAAVEERRPEPPTLTPGSTPEQVAARPFSRLAAKTVDFALLLIFFLFFVAAAEIIIGGTQPAIASFLTLLVPYFLVFFCLCFGYFTLFHYLVGQTLGKMLFGLRVVGVGQEPLLISQVFLRTTGGLISALPAGIGFLVVLADPQGRGWSDRLAGTRVVEIGAVPHRRPRQGELDEN